MKFEINLVREIHGYCEYKVIYEEAGAKFETSVSVVGSTVNYSNDLLPDDLMDFIDKWLLG